MVFVILKRNWFGPDGARHRVTDGMFQIPDDQVDQLPSTARVFDDNKKELPSRSLLPKPGFGAKIAEEQILDVIPGAAPVHSTVATGTGGERTPFTPEEQKKLDAQAAERQKVRDAEAATPEHKEEQKKIDAAVVEAEKLTDNLVKATDPVATAAKK